ncbi:MAG: sigma-70 family RNA polymerase sigma factor [Chloroflexi bacterium]|nr:MAG: sigma-70 family RNA polymerase sigma factor [Chloroflexota bacterium]
MSKQGLNLRDDASDADLMAQLAAGERWPMGVLYDRYARLVYSMVLKILHDQERAEDVVQEVFVRVWRGAGSFQAGRGNFTNWLLGIAHHRAIDELRRQGSQQRRAVFVDDENALRSVPDPGEGPAEAAWIAQKRLAIREALRQLPAEQRQTVELAYFGGLTQREIAEHTGTPLGTVKTRMRLALQKLRNHLEKEELGSPALSSE